MAESVKIEGLPEFQAAVKNISQQLPKEMKEAAQQIASDWINAARGKASRPMAREAMGAMSVGNDPDGATIVNSHPMFYGEEFGGRARPETMHFPPHVGQRGYFLFPAARENADRFQKVWEAAIDKATESWDHKE